MENQVHHEPGAPEAVVCKLLKQIADRVKSLFVSGRLAAPGAGSFNDLPASCCSEEEISMAKTEDHEPCKLPYQLLKQITNDFNVERILGSGGFGTVYRGVYENREEIAVKVLHNNSKFDDKEFCKEFANLRGLQHPNIVKLVGYCNETEKELVEFEGNHVIADRFRLALCFEFVENGTLNKHISDENTGLTWNTRYKIIKGICEGLKYLREGREYPIMHFDLKPDNILLDNSMVPKIADFGLAKLFGEENTRQATSFLGTRGYCPPEYMRHQIMSSQFDIYSLGVIIVRIMTGNERYYSVVELAKWKAVRLVHAIWREKLRETLSHRSLEVYCNQVKTCIEIAFDCLIPTRHDRPTIQYILSCLNETEIMIGHQVPQNEQFVQEHAEVIRSTNSNHYLSATEPMVMTFQFQELCRMTDGFSNERLLGNGRYGSVYKGVLDNEQVIAVKRLNRQPGLVEDIFNNELLNLMMIQHQNIVRLVGYCFDTRDIVSEHEGRLVLAVEQERALCFEYMQGGTLEELLSDESCGLDWEASFNIIKGICQGLKHLHTASKDPIYHLDLTPANILLDKDMIPKIGDFGLSRLLPSMGTFVTKTNSGTLLYMPPEYADGLISSKFDVFSLGVIIIQIIAGSEGYYNYKLYGSPQEFIKHVTGNWSKRVQEEIMSTQALLEVQKCIKIALRCVEANRENRPTITDMVEEMNMIDLHPAPFCADPGDETTSAALSNSLADLLIMNK